MVDLSFPVRELEYFLLVFARVATFVFAAPFFSQKGVPNQVKIGLSVFVAYLMYAFVQPHTYPEYSTVFGYSVIIAKEVAVGLFLGAGAQLCTSIVLFAGRIIDMEIGLSMANVFDPTTNQQSSISGLFLQYGVMLILFATGLVYATSAVTVFFRDMKEVVGILLQIGMWVTPIMWNFETMVQIPGWAITVLKLNPMYYIVSGYRNALINHIGFWEDMGLTVYFWVVTAVILFLGTTVFKRLRPHFADVL